MRQCRHTMRTGGVVELQHPTHNAMRMEHALAEGAHLHCGLELPIQTHYAIFIIIIINFARQHHSVDPALLAVLLLGGVRSRGVRSKGYT